MITAELEHMSDEVELWCWVQGDGLDRVFSVRVERSATVRRLKEKIREKKPSFEKVAADSLELWKVANSISMRCGTDLTSC